MDKDIRKALDPVFWDLRDESVISKVLGLIQKGVYDQLFTDTEGLYNNLFIHKANNLFLFSELFNVSDRTMLFSGDFKDYEVFRMKIFGLWFASIFMPTLKGLNYLIGGFTAQPVFIDRVADIFEMSWWLGVYENGLPKGSFLNGTGPNIYDEPRTWLRSAYSIATGIRILMFGEGVDLIMHSEEKTEFNYWLKKMYTPTYIYTKLFDTREPSGFYLWGLGYGGTFILYNLEQDGIFFKLTDSAVEDGVAFLETEFRPVNPGEFRFSIFDIILSDIIERRIFVNFIGSDEWLEIKPFGKFSCNVTQLRLKLEIKGIKNLADYRFISMMLRRE